MSLAAWLKQQGLERLEPLLRQAGIDLDIISDLADSDLRAVGLSLGDRKRLLKAISASPPVLIAKEFERAGIHSEVDVPAATAERRQLTVMFCDLVGSTLLSARLDPEDMRQVIAAYHHAIAEAVAPYEGYIAQFLGDGVMVYFGYPKAHEDDGERAMRAAIAVQKVVSRLRPLGIFSCKPASGLPPGWSSWARLVLVRRRQSSRPAAGHRHLRHGCTAALSRAKS